MQQSPAVAESPATNPPSDTVVQLDGVTVIYGANRALKNVSARFARGAVGLLGPNGAGKSTMLKALLGFVKPNEGRMTVLGLDVAKEPLAIRGRIGYMPESDAQIPGMNAVSFVAYCGQLAGLPAVDAMQRAHEVLYYVGLGEARYRNVETYSTGMKQRIKLAQALVHDPDLLFLDEPTNGMDPKGRDEMLELIRDLGHNKNVNLILSSHLLPDVEYTCDHVVVMDKGTSRRTGTDRRTERARGPRLRAADQGRRADVHRRAPRIRYGVPWHRRRRHAGVRARRHCRGWQRAIGNLHARRAKGGAGATPASEHSDAGRRIRQGGRRAVACLSTIKATADTRDSRRLSGARGR